jgi:uncharacterized damage-inducible protein DinB
VSKLTTVRRLIAYDRAVFERYQRAVERLGWKEADADRGIGHGSLKNTLVHILNVHEAWLVAVAQGRWEIFEVPGRRPDAIGSWKDLRQYRARVWSGIDGLMEHLTESKLGRRIKAPWMPGTYTLEDGFFQSSFEQGHHLGEVIGVYRQLDREPPEMTWIRNLPETRGGPRRVTRRARRK